MSEHSYYDFQKVLDAVGPRIEQLVTHLLPAARKQAGSYRCGDSSGERGSSFSVSTKPNNAGSFIDHSNPSVHGNAIGLWALTRNLSYQEAGAQLAVFLGVSPEVRLHMPKKRPKPRIHKDEEGRTRTFEIGERTVQIQPLNHRAIAYALGRGITEDTLRRAKCTSTDTDIVFPHFDEDGNVCMLKTWSCDGLKRIFSNTDPVPTLFGKPMVDPIKSGSVLIITEGHWDALTWQQLGYPAVSIPNGVSNEEWIGEDWNFLNCFSQIYLDFDSDPKGQEAELKAKVRLGMERCRSIKYRFKDANAALQAGEAQVLHEAFAHARDAPIERIIQPESIRSKVRERLSCNSIETGIPFFLPNVNFAFRPHENTVWYGSTSHGKALPLDTLVPTTHGHRTMKMLEKGDYVYGSNGQPTKIIATSEIFEGNDCYEIQFQDRLKVVADANHLWQLDTHASRVSKRSRARKAEAGYKGRTNYCQDHKINRGVMMTTEELFNSNLRTVVSGKERFNYTIPVAPAFEGVEADLPIPPYTLGAWLGDGTSANAQITSHPDDFGVLERIAQDGFVIQKTNVKYRHLIKGLSTALRTAEVMNNKHIPEIYFNASKEQRMDLLRGLMDTDGSISNGRQCEFCSVKEHFAHQVQRLANGLGIKACMNIGNAILNGRIIGKKYRVQWTNSAPVFHLKRKLERLPAKVGPDAMNRMIVSVKKVESVPTKCIVVDAEDHLFLCTENCIITHNSTVLSNQICYAAMLGEKSFVASFEQDSPMTVAGMLAQYTADGLIGDSSSYNEAFDHLMERVLFFDSMARANPKEIISTIILAHKQLGISQAVVDNVMTLEVDRQDNTAQAEVADAFRVLTAQLPIHLHLVMHPRKPPSDSATKPPSISDIMGASEWSAMAHNVICVWRDVAKALILAEMIDDNRDPMDIRLFNESTPDGKVFWRKQRKTGELPMVSYFFDKVTKRAYKELDQAAPYFFPAEVASDEDLSLTLPDE